MSKRTWGEWIAARSEHLGFRSQKSLASAIGCSADQLQAWLAMEEPPLRMRKGFDVKLPRALKTDAATLFVRWKTVRAEGTIILESNESRDSLFVAGKDHAGLAALINDDLQHLDVDQLAQIRRLTGTLAELNHRTPGSSKESKLQAKYLPVPKMR
jgi:hypothetical protein